MGFTASAFDRLTVGQVEDMAANGHPVARRMVAGQRRREAEIVRRIDARAQAARQRTEQAEERSRFMTKVAVVSCAATLVSTATAVIAVAG